MSQNRLIVFFVVYFDQLLNTLLPLAVIILNTLAVHLADNLRDKE